MIYSLIRINQLNDTVLLTAPATVLLGRACLKTVPQGELSCHGENSKDVHYIMLSKKSILYPIVIL